MNSFYGGPNGQSFTITKIFTSKNGDSDSLVWDLSLKWSSLITVGSFVVVSYGMPNDDNYNVYKSIDITKENKSFNSTLWRKEYYENLDDEDAGYRVRGEGGMSYRLIASLTGNTPRFDVGTTVLDANQLPDVDIDETDPDLPHLQFSLPQAQLFIDDNISSLEIDADLLPYIVVDCESSSDRINRPTLKFYLPLAQRIVGAEVEEALNADQEPSVRLDLDEPNSVNEPVLKFKLPVSLVFISDNVKANVVDANVKPDVKLSGDVNRPTLTFDLPLAQVMALPTKDIIGPAENPGVSLNDSDDINAPYLEFRLPRAVRFLYGTKLGKKADTSLTEESVAVGDYYINEPTGFVYIVELVSEGGEATVRYVACLERPLPQVAATGIDPFDAQGNPVQPSVTRRFLDEDETLWELRFSLPRAPQVNATYTSVPSTLKGGVRVTKGTTTAIFEFSIPTGTRMFSGSGAPTEVSEAKDGDFYFDMETGFVYQLNETEWTKKDGTLQGPIGETLNIVESYTIKETEEIKDSLAEGVKHIRENYKKPITSLMIFAITWTSFEDERDTAYWYFLPEGKNSEVDTDWSRVLLTGGTDNLIEKLYNDETQGTVDNKAYSVHYVNGLIGGQDEPEEELDRTAYSKKQIKELIAEILNSIEQSLLTWGDISEIPD